MRVILAAIAVITITVANTWAQDWSQWRGPTRDGVIPAAVIPKQWPKSVKRSWHVEIGEGYSSPVVANGRAFLHSRRDPDEIVTAIDLATGKVVWQQKYPASFTKNQYATQMAKGPNSTPLVVGGRLFTLGVTGILTAWNVADGTIAWRQDYSASIDTSKLFCGTAMSPMLEGGALIVQIGSDVHGGRVLALDPATGKERWSWTGPGPGYASPVAASIDGVRQIITLTNGSVVGINAATGASLWSIPFPDEWHENIVTPIWTGSSLIVSGTRQGTHAYSIANSGGHLANETVVEEQRRHHVHRVTSVHRRRDLRHVQQAPRTVRGDSRDRWLAEVVHARTRRQPCVDPAGERTRAVPHRRRRADRGAPLRRGIYRGAPLRDRPQHDMGAADPAG